MNLPGVYLLHLAVITLLGDAAISPGGSSTWPGSPPPARCSAAYCAAAGRRVARLGAGALLFAPLSPERRGLARGAARFSALPLPARGRLRRGARSRAGGARWPLSGAGSPLGAGMTVKPHAALFWLACAAVAGAGRAARRHAAARSPCCVLAAGSPCPPRVRLARWRGGLGPFWRDRHRLRAAALQPRRPRLGVGGLALARLRLADLELLVGARPARASRAARRRRRASALARALGAVYGVAALRAQGKGWEYHLYPLAVFALRPRAPSAVARRGGRAAARAGIGAGALAARSRSASSLVLPWRPRRQGRGRADAPWIADKARRVSALDARPRRRWCAPGGTVQVMDVTEGGVHALLRLRLRQPTRFLYDFHFFHDAGDPRIQALRAEFVARPRGAAGPPPSWSSRHAGAAPGYERLDGFPEPWRGCSSATTPSPSRATATGSMRSERDP